MACSYWGLCFYNKIGEIFEFKANIFKLKLIENRGGVNTIYAVSEVGNEFSERNVLHVPLKHVLLFFVEGVLDPERKASDIEDKISPVLSNIVLIASNLIPNLIYSEIFFKKSEFVIVAMEKPKNTPAFL